MENDISIKNINNLPSFIKQPFFLTPNPDKSEPKKIGFTFTTKITKEKKNKIYNLRALRVLRGVIKLFLPQNGQNSTLRN